jgi:hypothetical protein
LASHDGPKGRARSERRAFFLDRAHKPSIRINWAACNPIPERIVDKPYLAGLGKHRPSDSGRNPYTPDAHRTRFGVYKPAACGLFRSFASQQRF